MYTLIPARLPSLCSSSVGRSSWRGGAGIIKPLRGTSGTLQSAIRGSSRRVLIYLGLLNVQTSLFSIGTQAPPTPTTAYRAVDIESSKHSLRDVLLGTLPKSQMEVTCGDSQRKVPRPQLAPITFFYFHIYVWLKTALNMHNRLLPKKTKLPHRILISRNWIFCKITTIFQTNKTRLKYLLLWLQ